MRRLQSVRLEDNGYQRDRNGAGLLPFLAFPSVREMSCHNGWVICDGLVAFTRDCSARKSEVKDLLLDGVEVAARVIDAILRGTELERLRSQDRVEYGAELPGFRGSLRMRIL